jgi:hypothetical protein
MPWYWTVGNVWQYTSSEFIDEHGRAVLLRGGSHYLTYQLRHSCLVATPAVTH